MDSLTTTDEIMWAITGIGALFAIGMGYAALSSRIEKWIEKRLKTRRCR